MNSVQKFEKDQHNTGKEAKLRLATQSCKSGSHSYSTSSDTVNNLSLNQQHGMSIPQTLGANSRSQMKKLVRKQAKLQQRTISKSLKMVPHICKIVSDTALLIENQLQKQTKLSNIRYAIFIKECEMSQSKLETRLEITNRGIAYESTPSEQNQLRQDTQTDKSNQLQQRLEITLFKMTKALSLPQQCLVIANIYVNHAIKQMAKKQFFLSTAIAESILVCCVILATKFYCETQDVVYNQDIDRLLSECKNKPSCKLNSMEAAMADILDYDLYVSLEEYNTEACKINQLIKKQRQEREAQAKTVSKSKAKKTANKLKRNALGQDILRSSLYMMPKFHSMNHLCQDKIQLKSKHNHQSQLIIESYDLGTLFSEEDEI